MSLTDNICNALADSAEITSFCQATYQKDQTIQNGVDFDELPGESDYPIIMIAEVGGLGGRVQDTLSAKYVLNLGIIDRSEPVIAGRVKKYNQVANLETFRELALTAIEAADLLGAHVAEADYENDPVELFPVFSTNLIISIKFLAPARGSWDR